MSEKNTSLTCPNCNEIAYASSSNDPNYLEDKAAKIFYCRKCGFHNKTNPMEYESLDSNDKIAAFNIAKRGLHNL